ncbi:hypothetical protein PtB15_11B475 [Puccinia triticina]|nr:hypothetical protein PtB15_11B475 [Puccinia triticina]
MSPDLGPRTTFPLLKGPQSGQKSVQYTSNPLDYHLLASNPTNYLSYTLSAPALLRLLPHLRLFLLSAQLCL